MKKVWFLGILMWEFALVAVDPISWQDAYIVNNTTDVDLQVAAEVTGLPRPGNLDYTYESRPKHKQTWSVPKKGKEFGGVAKLAKLNLLDDITIQPQVDNMSKWPKWMQRPYPIKIADRQSGKVLIIYVGKTANNWLTEQQYVTSVKIVYGEGSAGYRLQIDQP